MTLEEILLQKLANWRPPAGRHELIVTDEAGRWTATVTADRCDELGCLLWELGVRRAPKSTPPTKTTTEWAQAIASRVTGLLEPLKVIEVDTVQNLALLRSSTATPRGERLYYYEVLLYGTVEARVCRYGAQQNNAGPRHQVAFALTHETLAKFVHDLCTEGA
jgi:hypothetical protein